MFEPEVADSEKRGFQVGSDSGLFSAFDRGVETGRAFANLYFGGTLSEENAHTGNCACWAVYERRAGPELDVLACD